MNYLRPLLALMIALATLLVPASAHAARGMEVALQDDAVFLHKAYYDREVAFQQARTLGVTRLRVNVVWSRVVANPTSPLRPATAVYDWRAYDELIAAAGRHGIRLQLTLMGGAPAWATANRKIGNRQVSPKAFAQFAGDAARHFRGRVARYSVWNEPNWHTFMEPSASCKLRKWGKSCDAKLGKLYRAMYLAGYKAIKKADPRAQVLIGELAPRTKNKKGELSTGPLKFLREITCSKTNWKAKRKCGRLYADGFAQHPYDFQARPAKKSSGRDDVTMATVHRLTSALDKLARRKALTTRSGRKLDVYLTEHGYFSSGYRKLPASKRAAYLRESFTMALRNKRVRQLVQYLLVTPPPAQNTFPTAIVEPTGSTHPAFGELADWARDQGSRIAKPLGTLTAPLL